MRIKPRSIRTKLALLFVLTVGAILTVQVVDAVLIMKHAREERSCTRNAAINGDRWGSPVGKAPNSIQTELKHIRLALTLSVTVALIALISAFVIGNTVVHSIRRLARAARALAVGDYRRRIVISTSDELQSLSESFNALGESLLRHEETLKEQSEMLAGMVEAARVASVSLDVRECGKAIAKAICTHLGAHDAAVFRKDSVDGGIRLVGKNGECNRSDWKRLAVHSADSGEYLVVSEQDCGRSGRSEAILVGAPLATGSETLGAIVARFGQGLSREDLRLGSLRADVLRAFAIHAAAAVANAEVHSRTEQYSAALEDWVEHASAVMQVTEAIAPSLNLNEALVSLAQATASVMKVDECTIMLPDRHGNLTMRAFSGSDKRKEKLMSLDFTRGSGSISEKVFSKKQPIACTDILSSDNESTRKLGEMSGHRGILSSPLIVGDEAIGVITLSCFEPRKFSRAEIQMLMSIGLHAAIVIRNAKLYTIEATIAEKLQTSLVSQAPEECRGLEFACRYIPALDEASVGGDFFDVAPLPDGRVAAIIADVSGKGLEAAIHLAACKYMLKALIHAHPDDPAIVLEELNESVNYYFQQDFFVTMFLAVIEPENGTIIYANAGHPPALLITENANMHTCLSSSGIPLGAGLPCKYQNQTVNAKQGDLLLLYTDGVTDAVKNSVRLELEGLHMLVFEAGQCSGAELINGIVEHLSNDFDSSRKDDVALLAVSFNCVTAASEEIGGHVSGGKHRITTRAG